MDKNILNLKEFELSEFQKAAVSGGFQSGGTGGNHTATNDSYCQGPSGPEVDSGGSVDFFLNPWQGGGGNLLGNPMPTPISTTPVAIVKSKKF